MRLIPLHPETKRPIGEAWHTRVIDPSELKPGAVGRQCLPSDAVLDIDPKHPDAARFYPDGVDPGTFLARKAAANAILDSLTADYGPAILEATRIRSGSGGLHIWLTKPPEVHTRGASRPLDAYGGAVELKTGGSLGDPKGSFCVWPPSIHPSTKLPYEVEHEGRQVELPEGILRAATEFSGPSSEPMDPLEPAAQEWLLGQIPATHFTGMSRVEWLGIIGDLHSLGFEREDVLNWAATDPDHNNRESRDATAYIWDTTRENGGRNGGTFLKIVAQLKGFTFRELLRKIRPALETIITMSDPDANAALFRQMWEPSLVFVRGDWWVYRNGAYITKPPNIVHSWIAEWLRESCWHWTEDKKTKKWSKEKVKATPGLIGGISQMLATRCAVDAPQSQVFWLDGRALPETSDLVNFQNGTLNLTDYTVSDHDPQLYTQSVLPYDWTPGASCPLWEKFLEEALPIKEERAVLQEVFGYIISGDLNAQRLFSFYGLPGTGKGTTTDTLLALIGKENYTSVTLQSLAGDFGLASMLGKSLAIVPEAAASKQNRVAALRVLKGVSGQDVMCVNRKHYPELSVQLSARFLLISQSFPYLDDAEGALGRRLIVFHFDKHPKQVDQDLREKLLKELPGIAAWSMRGYDRYLQRGKFVLPTSITERVSNILRDQRSPVSVFIEEATTPGGETEKDLLWAVYDGWQRNAGIRDRMSKIQFFKRLRDLHPDIKEGRSLVDGKRPRVMKGVTLVETDL